MSNNYNKAWLCPVIIGIILVTIGVAIKIPGGVLTTYGVLDGKSTDSYIYDNKYSAIDEYVGGDAYNFIIGASLVAGKISGTMTTKAVFIVGGLLCICFGITLMMRKKDSPTPKTVSNATENTDG